MKTIIDYFFAYLKLHIKSLLLFAVFAAVFAAVFSLYSLPAEAVIYACALCLVLAAVIAAVGFARFVRRCRTLEKLSGAVEYGLDDLPEPRNLTEADYTALIKKLYDAKRKSESDADARFAALSEYVTLWAHQIKTPIAAMRLMKTVTDDPETDDQLFAIERYVDTLLQYVRTEEGVSDWVVRPVCIDDAVRKAVRKYAKQFIRKKLTLDFEPTGIVAVTDEKWLRFVVEQLLSNAVKYTREGGVVIKPGDAPRTLVIADTGVGIDPADLPRVCELGYTGFNGRADSASTGIGLYLCAKIMKKLRHTMALTSEPGRGTTVTLGFDEVPDRVE